MPGTTASARSAWAVWSRNMAHLPADQLRERVLREIAAFVGDAPQHDDMTMILLKVEDLGVQHAPQYTINTSAAALRMSGQATGS